MGNKKKFVFVFIFLFIASCWAGNIYYYEKNKIDSALFFNTYKEADIMGETTEVNKIHVGLKLYYIQNTQNDEICSVQFPELNSGDIFVQPMVVHTTGNFQTKCIGLCEPENSLMSSLSRKYLYKDNFYITKMNYRTSKGKRYEVNLGKIYFKNRMDIGYDIDLCNNTNSESSWEGDGKSKYTALYNLNIVGVQSHFMDYLKQHADIMMDNMPIDKVKFPKSIKDNGTFNVSYKLKNVDDCDSLNIRFNVITTAGRVKSYEQVEINNDNNISNDDISLKTIRKLIAGGRSAHEISSK